MFGRYQFNPIDISGSLNVTYFKEWWFLKVPFTEFPLLRRKWPTHIEDRIFQYLFVLKDSSTGEFYVGTFGNKNHQKRNGAYDVRRNLIVYRLKIINGDVGYRVEMLTTDLWGIPDYLAQSANLRFYVCYHYDEQDILAETSMTYPDYNYSDPLVPVKIYHFIVDKTPNTVNNNTSSTVKRIRTYKSDKTKQTKEHAPMSRMGANIICSPHGLKFRYVYLYGGELLFEADDEGAAGKLAESFRGVPFKKEKQWIKLDDLWLFDTVWGSWKCLLPVSFYYNTKTFENWKQMNEKNPDKYPTYGHGQRPRSKGLCSVFFKKGLFEKKIFYYGMGYRGCSNFDELTEDEKRQYELKSRNELHYYDLHLNKWVQTAYDQILPSIVSFNGQKLEKLASGNEILLSAYGASTIDYKLNAMIIYGGRKAGFGEYSIANLDRGVSNDVIVIDLSTFKSVIIKNLNVPPLAGHRIEFDKKNSVLLIFPLDLTLDNYEQVGNSSIKINGTQDGLLFGQLQDSTNLNTGELLSMVAERRGKMQPVFNVEGAVPKPVKQFYYINWDFIRDELKRLQLAGI